MWAKHMAGNRRGDGLAERLLLVKSREPFWVMRELNQTLLEWERVYNTVRPHQALGYLAPKEFLEYYLKNQRKEVICH